MARKKVQLHYIQDSAARKASFKKRRQGLLKKVEELSVLCDVTACVVVYGEEGTAELPVHWPLERAGVERALWEYQASPDMERWKRTVMQEDYVKERSEKFTEQLKKLGRKIHELEMYHMMQLVYLDGRSHEEFTTSELMSLRAFAGERVNELERRVKFLLEIGNAPQPESNLRGSAQKSNQGGSSVATDGGGRSTTGPFRFPGAKLEFGGSSRMNNDLNGVRDAVVRYSTFHPLSRTILGIMPPYAVSCFVGGNTSSPGPNAREPSIAASVLRGHIGSIHNYIHATPVMQNQMVEGINKNRSYNTPARPANCNLRN